MPSYSFGQYCSMLCWEHSSTYGIHIVLESKSLPKMPNFLVDMLMVCNWGNAQGVLFMLHVFCFHLKNYCFMYSVISVINKDAFYVLKNVFYWHLFCYHTEVCIFLDTFVFERNKIFIWVLQMQAQIFYLGFTNAGLCLNS